MDQDRDEDLARETSTRTGDGVIPTGYGTNGGYIGETKGEEEEENERPEDVASDP
jgi:hypothetical protein